MSSLLGPEKKNVILQEMTYWGLPYARMQYKYGAMFTVTNQGLRACSWIRLEELTLSVTRTYCLMEVESVAAD